MTTLMLKDLDEDAERMCEALEGAADELGRLSRGERSAVSAERARAFSVARTHIETALLWLGRAMVTR